VEHGTKRNGRVIKWKRVNILQEKRLKENLLARFLNPIFIPKISIG
jgi:hypothetical protein